MARGEAGEQWLKQAAVVNTEKTSRKDLKEENGRPKVEGKRKAKTGRHWQDCLWGL
jgi:hypothetical protein